MGLISAKHGSGGLTPTGDRACSGGSGRACRPCGPVAYLVCRHSEGGSFEKRNMIRYHAILHYPGGVVGFIIVYWVGRRRHALDS